MLSEKDLDIYLEKMYNKPIDRILKKDLPKAIKKLKKPDSLTSNKNKSMKTKPGTAKPSGNIGKGSPAASPTTGSGGNLKPKGGKQKGGKTKKGM